MDVLESSPRSSEARAKHVTRACQGLLLTLTEVICQAMARTSTKKSLQTTGEFSSVGARNGAHPQKGATAPQPFMPWIYVWRLNNRKRLPPAPTRAGSDG